MENFILKCPILIFNTKMSQLNFISGNKRFCYKTPNLTHFHHNYIFLVTSESVRGCDKRKRLR